MCTNPSSIASNFNGTAIGAGKYLWFNSHLNVSGLGSAPATIFFTGQTIQFTANSTAYTVNVPNAQVTIDPLATMATTTFNTGTNTWITITPPGTSGNIFLSGLAFLVPASGLPGGINPVTWGGGFSSDTAGVTIDWQWSAAVYTSFTTNYNAIGVKPVDDNSASQYMNSDHAGTPENFKGFVIGGARGGGGSNLTGSNSSTGDAEPCAPSAPQPTPTKTRRPR